MQSSSGIMREYLKELPNHDPEGGGSDSEANG